MLEEAILIACLFNICCEAEMYVLVAFHLTSLCFSLFGFKCSLFSFFLHSDVHL